MNKIDDYFMLHLTEFMTHRSFANLAITSRRFRLPMIQKRLKERIESSYFMEIAGIPLQPVSIVRDCKQTHIDFKIDCIVYEQKITLHTEHWIFNWERISSSSYIWDYTSDIGITFCRVKDTYAEIVMNLLYDENEKDYRITNVKFSYNTHIAKHDTSFRNIYWFACICGFVVYYIPFSILFIGIFSYVWYITNTSNMHTISMIPTT